MKHDEARKLLEALGIVEEQQPDQPEPEAPASPDFDGGAREPLPEPGDPEADHNAFLTELFRTMPPGGGGSGEW